MGKLVERLAAGRGHEIVLVVDEYNRNSTSGEQLEMAEVAIEFSVPAVAADNYKWCFDHGVSVVSGTTGWLDRWDEVVEYCRQRDGGFFYASNFSIGVNVFFQLNKYLAGMMSRFDDYQVFVEETHHIHKIDAPSGTAITLAEGILDNHGGYSSWELNSGGCPSKGVLPVSAKRIGEVPGIHAVTYKSDVDEIVIRHSAISREGFARGAVLAAEFMKGKKGVYNMDDLLDFDGRKGE